MQPVFQYHAMPQRLVDADTIKVTVDLGFRTYITTPLRLLGINAPEKNTQPGQEAIKWVQGWMGQGRAWDDGLIVSSAHPGDYGDKYGRWLGTVYDLDGRCLNADILKAGHAVVMKG